jgi:hypothetical protein
MSTQSEPRGISVPLSLPAGLPPEVMKMIALMVRGREQDCRPLSLQAAAIACGVGVRTVKSIARSKLFQEAFAAEVEVYRQSLEPGNLAVALSIRDAHGDGSPECNSVRLKAVQVLRGAPKPSAVNIQVNQRTNIRAAISPGYVIKLDGTKEPSIEHANGD